MNFKNNKYLITDPGADSWAVSVLGDAKHLRASRHMPVDREPTIYRLAQLFPSAKISDIKVSHYEGTKQARLTKDGQKVAAYCWFLAGMISELRGLEHRRESAIQALRHYTYHIDSIALMSADEASTIINLYLNTK
jgi:hypothetical protein